MNIGPLKILLPLAFPLLAASVGFIAGMAVFRNFRQSLLLLSPVSIGFAILLLAAAIVSNSHQKLYDLGMSFPNIDILQIVVYGIVGLSISCLWWASGKVWFRGAIVVLALSALIQPFLSTFALATWTIGGFAP
jgi:hypothetical protein